MIATDITAIILYFLISILLYSSSEKFDLLWAPGVPSEIQHGIERFPSA